MAVSLLSIQNQSQALRTGIKHSLQEQGLMMFFALIAFGVVARENGFLLYEALLSTAAMWALPAQLAHVEAVATGSSLLMIATIVFLTNLRFFPMVVSLMSGLSSGSLVKTLGLTHFVSAASWAWCMSHFDSLPQHLRLRYFLGFAVTCWLMGILGTLCGFLLAEYLTSWLRILLLYLSPLYMALILLNVRGHRLVAVLLGALVGLVTYHWSPDWYLPVAALLAGTFGFWLSLKTSIKPVVNNGPEELS